MSDSTPKQSWWQRLSGGLKRTSSSIGTAISDLVSKRRLDAAMLDELEIIAIADCKRDGDLVSRKRGYTLN